VEGLDLAPARLDTAIAALALPVRAVNIETERLPHADGSVDLVLFNELFEHLRINPIATLREVLRILRPGGTLLLSTPNLLSLGGLRNLLWRGRAASAVSALYDEYAKLQTHGSMGHVREYTPVEVTEFVTRVGFTVEEVVHRGRYRVPAAHAITRALPRLRPFFTVVARRPVVATA